MASKSSGKGSTKVVAGVLAIVAALAIVLLGIKSGYGSATAGAAAGAPRVPQSAVLVAKLDVANGHKLTADDVTLVSYNKGTEPKHFIGTVDAAVGMYVLGDQAAGTPLTTDNLASHPDGVSLQAEHDGQTPTSDFTVPDGMVAIAIPTAGIGGGATSAVNNVGNYVKPGNRIDIIGDPGVGGTRYLFQDILVLKVGSAPAPAAGSSTTTTTAASATSDVLVVLMSRQQAEQMTFLLNSKSTVTLKYVLRGSDAAKGVLPSTGTPAAPPAADPPVTSGSFAG